MADIEIIIKRNPDKNRFEAHYHDFMAELTYRETDDHIAFTHTGVPEKMEGHGVGSALAEAGLEYAKQKELKVRPICPFVKAYIRRHEQYQELVA